MPDGYFLVPLQLFSLGGEYSAENLRLYPFDAAVRVYDGLREGIKDIPDGTQIKLAAKE